MPIPEEELLGRLAKINDEGLLRTLKTVDGTGGVMQQADGRVLNLSSNDYLDLANHPGVRQAASRAALDHGGGATASRLMAGNYPLYDLLEADLAQMCGTASALVFGSGFLGNVGALGALCRKQDVILADKLNHASLIDGMLLAGCASYRYRHNDMAHLRRFLQEKIPDGARAVIVSDSIFSMDGDCAPLADLVALAEEFQAALVIDEAHAIGVFGPRGGGALQAQGLEGKADLIMGTLSKSLGSYGGFAACSAVMREYLINKARTFIFSTGLPPAVLGAARESLRLIREAGGELGNRLLQNAQFFKDELAALGIRTDPSVSQIIPVLVGANVAAVQAARALQEQGVWATAIRPPTVPAGTARLRMSVTLAHSRADLSAVARTLRQVVPPPASLPG